MACAQSEQENKPLSSAKEGKEEVSSSLREKQSLRGDDNYWKRRQRLKKAEEAVCAVFCGLRQSGN